MSTQSTTEGAGQPDQREQMIARLTALATLLREHPELGAPRLTVDPDTDVLGSASQETIPHWSALLGLGINVHGRGDRTQADVAGWPDSGPFAEVYVQIMASRPCGQIADAHDHGACIADLRDRVGGRS